VHKKYTNGKESGGKKKEKMASDLNDTLKYHLFISE
jgi:hypothetical protein